VKGRILAGWAQKSSEPCSPFLGLIGLHKSPRLG
jgi:hypothetical protein